MVPQDYVQNTITAEPLVGLPGMNYDVGPYDIITCIAQGDIPFGAYVRVSGGNCALPASSADITAGEGGIAMRVPTRPSGGGHKQGDNVPVLRQGRVWVQTEQGMAAQASPLVRFVAGAGGIALGAVRNDADSASAVAPLSGMTVFRGTAAAGLAALQLNYPGAGK